MKFFLVEFCPVCILPDWPLSDVPGHAIVPEYFCLSQHLNRVATSSVISVALRSRQTWMEGDLGEDCLPVLLGLWKWASSVVKALWRVILCFAQARWKQCRCLMSGLPLVASSEITMWLLLLCLMFCLLRRSLSLRYSGKTRTQSHSIILRRNLTRAGAVGQRVVKMYLCWEKKPTPIFNGRGYFFKNSHDNVYSRGWNVDKGFNVYTILPS